jgi:hypothetical protein
MATNPPQYTELDQALFEEKLDKQLKRLRAKVLKARAKHPTWPTPHHGLSCIREEVKELEKHVYDDAGETTEAADEALDIAVTGIRYIIDLTDAGK